MHAFTYSTLPPYGDKSHTGVCFQRRREGGAGGDNRTGWHPYQRWHQHDKMNEYSVYLLQEKSWRWIFQGDEVSERAHLIQIGYHDLEGIWKQQRLFLKNPKIGNC